MPASERRVELELLLRAGAPSSAAASQRAVRERTEALADTYDHVDVAVTRVDRYVALDDRERFQRLQAWAEQASVSLHPGFDIRLRHGAGRDTREVLIPPVVALVVSEDEELSAVYPHTDGSDHRSVVAALADLETELGAEQPSTTQVRTDSHPSPDSRTP